MINVLHIYKPAFCYVEIDSCAQHFLYEHWNIEIVGIEIKCDRSSGIKVTYQDKTTKEITTKNENNNYFIQAKEAMKVTKVEPICSDEDGVNYIIHKELTQSSLYLVEYPTSRGVKETNNILGGGFKYEIIHSISSVNYIKSTEGSINFNPLVTISDTSRKSLNQMEITYHRIKSSDKEYEISFTSGESQVIPISRK